MKKILSIFGTITLIGTSTTSLVACNKTQEYYTPEKLAELKEKNNIKTKNGILEWIAPQEKPFNTVDNKYYFVVWRGNKNDGWRIAKFQNNTFDRIKIDDFNNKKLQIFDYFGRDLFINSPSSFITYVSDWKKDNGTYFKAVYRWNNDNEPNKPIIDPKTEQIKVEEE